MILILAKDKRSAMRKLLKITSSFGEFNERGLHDFMNEAGIKPVELSSGNFVLPELDVPDFLHNHFDIDPPWQGNDTGAGNAEMQIALSTIKIKCPAKQKDTIVGIIKTALKNRKGVSIG